MKRAKILSRNRASKQKAAGRLSRMTLATANCQPVQTLAEEVLVVGTADPLG